MGCGHWWEVDTGGRWVIDLQSRWDCYPLVSLVYLFTFLMAEDLNGYFSSAFTIEDIISLLVPDAKFQEAKSDYLGPLIVIP